MEFLELRYLQDPHVALEGKWKRRGKKSCTGSYGIKIDAHTGVLA